MHTHYDVQPHKPIQEPVKSADTRGVVTAEGAHLYYLPFDKLDAIVLVEDTDLGHSIVLVDAEGVFS